MDRQSRVAAFVRDLDGSLSVVTGALRPKAYMIWTIGNRRVGGEPVPTDAILEELLGAKGVRPVTRVERKIPDEEDGDEKCHREHDAMRGDPRVQEDVANGCGERSRTATIRHQLGRCIPGWARNS